MSQADNQLFNINTSLTIMPGVDNGERVRLPRTSQSSKWLLGKMDDESANTASIACEPCRQKKCKCDRKLPICTQCGANSSGKCQYPEQSRRGIPAGYLNALERRIAETERALFFALAEIHTGIIEENEYPNAAKKAIKPLSPSKAEMMANWARLSLNTRDQTLAWFLDHRLPTHDQFQNASAILGQEALENASNPSPVPSSRGEQLSPSVHSGSHFSEAPHWVPSRRGPPHTPVGEYDSSYHNQMDLDSVQNRSQSQEMAGLTGLEDATVPPAGNQSRARIVARDNKRTYF